MSSRLTEERLNSLYTADDFGGATTMRGRVFRELIDEIRNLRKQEAAANTAVPQPRATET